jgi:hypothetical protein
MMAKEAVIDARMLSGLEQVCSPLAARATTRMELSDDSDTSSNEQDRQDDNDDDAL